MKYPFKYLKYWFFGVIISFTGVFLARKMPDASAISLVGYALAIIGLAVIAYGVSKKAKDETI